MGRRKPQGRHAKAFKIIQLVLDALEIAHAVPVAVGEGVNQQLISDIGKFVSGLEDYPVREEGKTLPVLFLFPLSGILMQERAINSAARV